MTSTEIIVLIGSNIIIVSVMLAIYILSQKIKEQSSPEQKNQNIHTCKFCRHLVIKGISPYTNKLKTYCVHPDNTIVTELDTINLDFYCGKWQLTREYLDNQQRNMLENLYNKEEIQK